MMRLEAAVQGFPGAGRVAAVQRGRLPTWVVVLLVGVVATLGCVAALLTLSGGSAGRARSARHGLESLPLAAQAPVSAALGHDDRAYRVTALQALNPAQHLRASFSRAGVTVASGRARLGMTLSAYGYASSHQVVGFARPRASANRVSYAHGALTEWYANGPLGIEQGFDVATRPGAGTGPLTLSLALSGDLAAGLRDGSVLLTGRGVALRYGGLVATDERGRVLHSWLGVAKGHVLIHIADRGATYPLRIDPLIQQGEKLTGAGEIASGRFGYSVALSADGDTALIGARYDSRTKMKPGGRGCLRARAPPGPSRAESSPARATPEKPCSTTSEKANSVTASRSPPTATRHLSAGPATMTTPARRGCSPARGPPGPSRAKSSSATAPAVAPTRAAARPEKANSARASRSPPTATRR